MPSATNNPPYTIVCLYGHSLNGYGCFYKYRVRGIKKRAAFLWAKFSSVTVRCAPVYILNDLLSEIKNLLLQEVFY